MNALIVAAGVIRRGKELLLCQRPDDKSLEAGKWEFPGGKLEEGETPKQALVRELKEELDIDVTVSRILDARIKRYEGGAILVLFYECSIANGTPKALEHKRITYVRPEELTQYDLADADRCAAETIIRDKENANA